MDFEGAVVLLCASGSYGLVGEYCVDCPMGAVCPGREVYVDLVKVINANLGFRQPCINHLNPLFIAGYSWLLALQPVCSGFEMRLHSQWPESCSEWMPLVRCMLASRVVPRK